MVECIFCKSDTELHEGGVPVCVKCSESRDSKRKPTTSEDQVLNVLREDFQSAAGRAKAATAAFDAVASEIPSGINHPDGKQRLQNASREATIARMEMLRAHHRLSDYLNARIVPEDLKQRSGS
jgi:hypothetical protein